MTVVHVSMCCLFKIHFISISSSLSRSFKYFHLFRPSEYDYVVSTFLVFSVSPLLGPFILCTFYFSNNISKNKNYYECPHCAVF